MISTSTPTVIAQAGSDLVDQIFLSPAPKTGEGVHGWCFGAAHYLREQGVDDPAAVIARLLKETADCGRDASRCIRTAVEKAFNKPLAELSNGYDGAGPTWPKVDLALVASISKKEPFTLDEWMAISPESPSLMAQDEAGTPEKIIDALFPGDPLLCVGMNAQKVATEHREKMRGHLYKFPLIVPSPMSAREGKAQQGHSSPRTLDNTGPRRWLVIDLDTTGDYDEQASVMRHLAKMAPLALVIYTGGKGLHGWFWANGVPEEDLRVFMDYACLLGADHSMFPRCQLARIPGSRRTDKDKRDGTYGRRHGVYYFDPSCINWEVQS